jgi:hypothetical protein
MGFENLSPSYEWQMTDVGCAEPKAKRMRGFPQRHQAGNASLIPAYAN